MMTMLGLCCCCCAIACGLATVTPVTTASRPTHIKCIVLMVISLIARNERVSLRQRPNLRQWPRSKNATGQSWCGGMHHPGPKLRGKRLGPLRSQNENLHRSSLCQLSPATDTPPHQLMRKKRHKETADYLSGARVSGSVESD